MQYELDVIYHRVSHNITEVLRSSLIPITVKNPMRVPNMELWDGSHGAFPETMPQNCPCRHVGFAEVHRPANLNGFSYTEYDILIVKMYQIINNVW